MAEINERASTSSDPPAPVTGTMNPALTTLANDAFHRVGAFLRGQIEDSINEYASLEEMNKVTVQKYVDMKDLAAVVSDRLTNLNRKCEALRPYLQQIDEIDENTRRLEEAAVALDSYVTTIGAFQFVCELLVGDPSCPATTFSIEAKQTADDATGISMSHEEPIRAVQFHDCDDDLRKHSQVEKLVERINSKAGHTVITVADAE